MLEQVGGQERQTTAVDARLAQCKTNCFCFVFSALKILHVGEDISSRGFFFFFSGFFGGGFPPFFFFFFGGLGWRIILLGVL